MERKSQLNLLIKVAILGALAGAIMLLKVTIPIFPSFLEVDLSDVPAVIGALVLGPIAGILIEVIKIIVNLAIQGSITFGVGEAANLVSGIAFVLPVGLIYKYNKSFKGAIIGCLVGAISLTAVMSISNYYIFMPLFAKAFGMEVEAYVGFSQVLPPFGKYITNLKDVILFHFVPFNLLKGLVVAGVTLAVYKFVVPPLTRIQNN